jgi:hypothetical protein
MVVRAEMINLRDLARYNMECALEILPDAMTAVRCRVTIIMSAVTGRNARAVTDN